MLPKAPKDVGRLSDVFASALASVGVGGENRLRLPRVRHSIVILVDGLGVENLSENKGYARFLNSKLNSSIRCEFPSTTATSLTGLATGTRSGSHGVIGYSVYSRKLQNQMNLLTGWDSAEQASLFKRVSDLSCLAEITTTVIGPGHYEHTGFTELTMSGASYLAAESLAERFECAIRNVSKTSRSVTYLYVPELDQTAHRFGVGSRKWIEALENLDSEVSKFASRLTSDVGVILTADHGVMDVVHEHHFYLENLDWYQSAVLSTAGDPRCNFIYLKMQIDLGEFKQKLATEFGANAYVCSHQELVDSGWVTEPEHDFSDFLPDLYLIWQGDYVGYDRRTAKAQHLKLIGQHGGISDRETRIPLVKFGAY